MPLFDITNPDAPLDFKAAVAKVQARTFSITQGGWCAEGSDLREDKFNEIIPYYFIIDAMSYSGGVYEMINKIMQNIKPNNTAHQGLSCMGMDVDSGNHFIRSDFHFGYGELMLFLLSRGKVIDFSVTNSSTITVVVAEDLLKIPRVVPKRLKPSASNLHGWAGGAA